MTIEPARLLKMLEPAVRPAAAPAPVARPGPPLEGQSFDALLTLVASGKVSSGAPVTVAPDAGLAEPLAEGQLARLAAGADVAAAHGARRAVMLIDGRGLVLDVAGRAITGELSAENGRRIHDVDAAVHVAAEGVESRHPPPRGPAAGVPPPGVARQLDAAARSRA